MFRACLVPLLFMSLVFVSHARAGYTLIDVTVNPGGWNTLTSGYSSSITDLGSLPDFGGTGIDGPLTALGSGMIPADFIPGNITITIDGVAPAQPYFFGAGPSLGLGNPQNAILVNDAANAMVVEFATAIDAFEFSYVSFLGSGPIIMEVTNEANQTTFYTGLSAPIAGGNRYGILGTGGDRIKRIRLHDHGVGFEGITGSFVTFAVPEPGSLVLVSAGLMVCGLRRRRPAP